MLEPCASAYFWCFSTGIQEPIHTRAALRESQSQHGSSTFQFPTAEWSLLGLESDSGVKQKRHLFTVHTSMQHDLRCEQVCENQHVMLASNVSGISIQLRKFALRIHFVQLFYSTSLSRRLGIFKFWECISMVCNITTNNI